MWSQRNVFMVTPAPTSVAGIVGEHLVIASNHIEVKSRGGHEYTEKELYLEVTVKDREGEPVVFRTRYAEARPTESVAISNVALVSVDDSVYAVTFGAVGHKIYCCSFNLGELKGESGVFGTVPKHTQVAAMDFEVTSPVAVINLSTMDTHTSTHHHVIMACTFNVIHDALFAYREDIHNFNTYAVSRNSGSMPAVYKVADTGPDSLCTYLVNYGGKVVRIEYLGACGFKVTEEYRHITLIPRDVVMDRRINDKGAAVVPVRNAAGNPWLWEPTDTRYREPYDLKFDRIIYDDGDTSVSGQLVIRDGEYYRLTPDTLIPQQLIEEKLPMNEMFTAAMGEDFNPAHAVSYAIRPAHHDMPAYFGYHYYIARPTMVIDSPLCGMFHAEGEESANVD